MKKSILLTATAATLAFSALAEARTSSDAELRGYTNCLAEAKKDSNGLVPSRQYLIDRTGANTLYYVNASRWEDGQRNYIRVACETAAHGRVVSAVIEDGRFTNNAGHVTVEVAQN